jgi:hypothetical protein
VDNKMYYNNKPSFNLHLKLGFKPVGVGMQKILK